MSGLPPLLPTPPATLKRRCPDAAESRAPKRQCSVEPPPPSIRRQEYESTCSSSNRLETKTPSSKGPPPGSCPRREDDPPYSSSKSPESKPGRRRRRRGKGPPRPHPPAPLPPPPAALLPPPSPPPQQQQPPPSSRRRDEHPPSSYSGRRQTKPPSRGRSRSEPPPSTAQRRERTPPPSISGCLANLLSAKLSRSGEGGASERRSVDMAAATGRGESEMVGPSSDDISIGANPSSHSKHPENANDAVEEGLDHEIKGDSQKLDGEKMKTPSRSARRKKLKRAFRNNSEWNEFKNEWMEMKKDKLLQKVKKLQACVWLLEKEGAGMPQIKEFRNLLESAEKEYVENEAQSAKEGPSAPHEWPNKDRDEKKVQDKTLVNLFKAVSKQSELAEEVNRLKSELQVVIQDRDKRLSQVQSLTADLGKQKEIARRCAVELDSAMRRVVPLEERCLLQREIIRSLEIQLSSANEKLAAYSTKDCG